MAILDWIKEIPLSAVYKERLADSERQIAALEQKILILEREKIELHARLEESEQDRRALKEQIIQKERESHNDNPDGYVCDHCASKNIRRAGSRLDPTFGPLGIKQKLFICNECNQESAFTPSS